jgi:hypothetical protein
VVFTDRRRAIVPDVSCMQTYDPLVELGEQVGDAEYEKFCDQLERFMAYINEALEEDGVGLSMRRCCWLDERRC